MITENIKVPTGNILIIDGEKGRKLECLSIGDYGKEKNIKADFLGLSEEINGVEHGRLLPLSEKWVVTVSTQYGCSSGCTFCDVPKVGPGINATAQDIINQVEACMSLHPEITSTKRLNLHYARMGEPTWNNDIFIATEHLFSTVNNTHRLHPVISTMLPRKNSQLLTFLQRWMYMKNEVFGGEAGLQFSINSTDDLQRDKMFSGSSLDLDEVSLISKKLPLPKGRKITLNFALNDTYEVDAPKLASLFNPDHFLVKITPMHMTQACVANNLHTSDGYGRYYPYQEAEKNLKKAGFDVIVFVPSKEEDESRITCGNAILSDVSEPDRSVSIAPIVPSGSL